MKSFVADCLALIALLVLIGGLVTILGGIYG